MFALHIDRSRMVLALATLLGACGNLPARGDDITVTVIRSTSGADEGLTPPGIGPSGEVAYHCSSTTPASPNIGVWRDGARYLRGGDAVPGVSGWTFMPGPPPVFMGVVTAGGGVPVHGSAINAAGNQQASGLWTGSGYVGLGSPALIAPNGRVASLHVAQDYSSASIDAGMPGDPGGPAGLTVIARSGDLIPDLTDGSRFGVPGFPIEFRPVAISDDNTVLIQARFSTGFGFWYTRNGAMGCLIRDGMPAPHLPLAANGQPCRINTNPANGLNYPSLNSNGLAAVAVTVTGGAFSQVIYAGFPDHLGLIEVAGAEAPLLKGGGSFTSFVHPVINNTSHIAFIASAANPIRAGLFLHTPEETRPIVLNTSPLPGTDKTIANVLSFWLNNRGHTACLVSLVGGGQALVTADAFGNASTVIKTGDVIGFPPAPITGLQLVVDNGGSVQAPGTGTNDGHATAFNDLDQLAFLATTSDGVSTWQHICRAIATFNTPPPADVDGDGIRDDWESPGAGLDLNGDGQPEIDLVALGASPAHKDLFIEVDAMNGWAPAPEIFPMVANAFGAAGITIHYEGAAGTDERNLPAAVWNDIWGDFDTYKYQFFGTPAQRAAQNSTYILAAKNIIYRYCIFANAAGATEEIRNHGGWAEIWGNDFMVTMGADGWVRAATQPFFREDATAQEAFPGIRRYDEAVAGVFMHELGHTLGLDHGGGDSINYKPNYHSVMNYTWFCPVPYRNYGWRLDFSSVVMPPLDESAFHEANGIGGTPGSVVTIGPPLAVSDPRRLASEWGPIDVDFPMPDGFADGVVRRDFNHVDPNDPASPDEILPGYNDWDNLRFSRSQNWNPGVHGLNAAGRSENEESAEMTPRILDLVSGTEPVPPPAAFNLILPANGQAVVPTGPSFDWQDSTGATSYDLTVDDDPNFGSPIVTQTGLTASQYTAPAGTLALCTQYFWKVVARGLTGTQLGEPASSAFTTGVAPICEVQPTSINAQPGATVGLLVTLKNQSSCVLTLDWSVSQTGGDAPLTFLGPTSGQIVVQPFQWPQLVVPAVVSAAAATPGSADISIQFSTNSVVVASGTAVVNVFSITPDWFELVSRSSDGIQANNWTHRVDISGDGRYAVFSTNANNLVPNDTNSYVDVFRRDRLTGQTIRVDVASDGSQADLGAGGPVAISADGRYVAFDSAATNLVPGVSNQFGGVFVHDCQTGQTSLVSRSSSGAEGNAMSTTAAISADGRYVAFASSASNLVSGDTNGRDDIFVRDLQAGLTTRASVSSTGAQGNDTSFDLAMSADARYVVFRSAATNLVSGDTNGKIDIFVRDRQTNTTTRISVATGGAQGTGGDCAWTSISSDGRYVVYQSTMTNLVAGDTNGKADVFLHDRQINATTRISVSSAGAQGDQISGTPRISAEGRYVVYSSGATNLVPDDTNNVDDIYRFDRQTAQTARLSIRSDGIEPNANCLAPVLSSDGRYVAFVANGSNLFASDVNGALADAVIRDMNAPPITSADINADGTIDAADAAALTAVLIGQPLHSWHVARSDINHDGVANGGDVQAFVALLGN